jgi:hypothetical protein
MLQILRALSPALPQDRAGFRMVDKPLPFAVGQERLRPEQRSVRTALRSEQTYEYFSSHATEHF